MTMLQQNATTLPEDPMLENTPLSRRRLLRTAGAMSALSLSGLARSAFGQGLATPVPTDLDVMASAVKLAPQLLVGSCALTPSQVEGPFYLPLNLLRKDLSREE